jgi:O-antigen/teichoic acid export membrane protein
LSTIRSSLAFSLADSYLGVLLQLASTLIISRILTPTDIGIFSVAAVIASLASTFRDFGVAEYLIQEKELTSQKIRAAFGANIIVSWLMAALLFGGSGAVADFYRQQGVADVMRIQSVSFLLIPFGAVTMAYFRRELNYRPIFIANLIANVSSFAVAVAGALMGFGYLSLAWSSLVGVMVTVGVSVLMRPADFPRLPTFTGLGEVARFGKHATGIYLFGQLGKSAPEAILGRVLNMASVAFFSRANGLIDIFNRTVLRAVEPVCLPYFSKETRMGQEISVGYLKATTLITGIGWPFLVVVGLMAWSATRLLYGPQWIQSVPLAQVLCLAAIVQLPHYLAAEVMIAHGRIDRSNRLQFWLQLMRILGILFVIPFGLAGACWGIVVATLAGAAVSQLFLTRIIGLRLRDAIAACLPSAGVALVSALPALVLTFVFEQGEANYFALLAGCGLLTAIAWLAALKLFKHPFWAEIAHILKRFKKS